MNIKKDGDKYQVESSRKGKFYEVEIEKPFCSCPQFLYRELKMHGECKHIKAVREFLSKKQKPSKKEEKKEKDLLDELRKGPADAMELVNKYGDRMIDSLKKRGDIIEEKGEVKILE
ncbi:MAG: hypothetical protein KKE20_05205 [Nanoarchaeota archaeon]|nr:hypothetical protein [Nanoarchaeota archaeon]